MIDIEGYNISGEIGHGTHGTVYKATAPNGVICAIKVLNHFDEINYQRFINECHILSQIHHEGIIESYCSGTTADGTHYMIMEYFEGMNFRQFMMDYSEVSLRDKVKIICKIAEAAAAAHIAGFVHRDLKPSNILINPETVQIKITDFGIALIPDSTLTQPLNMMGTPSYMSPEGFESPKVGPASDVYSLGAIAYEYFLGQPVFDYTKLNRIKDMRRKTLKEKHVQATDIDPSFPANLNKVLEKMLKKKRDERFQDCGQVVRALVKVMTEGFKRSRPVTRFRINLNKLK